MMASLFAGVSGLKNHQAKMNVIGNNIANINTIGFKAGRVNFQEALVQTFRGAGRPSSVSGGTNAIQLGLGAQVASVDNLFQQGGLETTGQITDLAIQGSGFFMLGDANGNRFYTRDGSFGFDANSTLVDPATGLYVLGRMADDTGQIPSLSTTGQIQLPFGQQDPARATESILISANLNATATDAFASLTNAGSSGVISVSGKALDGVGGTHVISIDDQGGNGQPTQDVLTGTNVAQDPSNPTFPLGVGALTGTLTLGELGVTDYAATSFGFSIDGSPMEYITGLNTDSTVNDVVSSINEIDGISAELVGGEIVVTRDMAGAHSDYDITSTVGSYTLDANGGATAGNIIGVLFGANTAIQSSGGLAHSFRVTDSFMPDVGSGSAAGPVVSDLQVVIDEVTGLVTGISGLGGDDSVTIKADLNGIQATPSGSELIVETDPTVHSTSINVYDSLGGRHTVTLEFHKSIVQNRWEWTASMLNNETIPSGRQGYVTFNSDGSLASFEYAAGASGITIDPANGAELIRMSIDAGTAFSFDGLTQFGAPSTASIIGQDGYGLGILEQIAIDKAGNISGIFSNGVTRILAQIMLADFNNQAGLRKAGRSLYQESPNSGQAIEGMAGSTVSAEITSGALEASAVDISQEFTSMITTQRGFQANSRIITTSDTLLDELVNLRR
jgi:flagellar hook protein FlgE